MLFRSFHFCSKFYTINIIFIAISNDWNYGTKDNGGLNVGGLREIRYKGSDT